MIPKERREMREGNLEELNPRIIHLARNGLLKISTHGIVDSSPTHDFKLITWRAAPASP
jgi:hypothetical protein